MVAALLMLGRGLPLGLQVYEQLHPLPGRNTSLGFVFGTPPCLTRLICMAKMQAAKCVCCREPRRWVCSGGCLLLWDWRGRPRRASCCFSSGPCFACPCCASTETDNCGLCAVSSCLFYLLEETKSNRLLPAEPTEKTGRQFLFQSTRLSGALVPETDQ